MASYPVRAGGHHVDRTCRLHVRKDQTGGGLKYAGKPLYVMLEILEARGTSRNTYRVRTTYLIPRAFAGWTA